MRISRRQLTPEDEAFYAGFTPLVIKPKPYAVGDQVDVIGDHPHAGKRGTVVSIEANPADRLLQREVFREALRVATLHTGEEFYVMEPRHVVRAR